MQNNKIVKFPRYLDSPKMLGILEMDEVFVAIFIVVCFILAGIKYELNAAIVILSGVFVGIIVGVLYHKFKENNPNGFTAHFAYRLGLFHPIIDNKALIVTKRYLRKKETKVIPTGILDLFIE